MKVTDSHKRQLKVHIRKMIEDIALDNKQDILEVARAFRDAAGEIAGEEFGKTLKDPNTTNIVFG